MLHSQSSILAWSAWQAGWQANRSELVGFRCERQPKELRSVWQVDQPLVDRQVGGQDVYFHVLNPNFATK